MRVLWLLFLCLLIVGCARPGDPVPIPGTSYRIGEEVPGTGADYTIDIMQSINDCGAANINAVEDSCAPYVNRATAEVRLSFVVRDPETSTVLRRTLEKDDIQLSHNLLEVQGFKLIPHDAISGGQLYILLIDGSGSMFENDGERIKKVYEALMNQQVVNGFFPQGQAKTGVILTRFNDKLRGLDGGAPKIITTAKQYRQEIRQHLMARSGGYTHLYGAIREGYTDLLSSPSVKKFISDNQAQPTFIALTDGYNNEAAADTCRTNVRRLQKTLDVISEVRDGLRGDLEPTLFTVGLGRPRAGVGKDLAKTRKGRPLTAKSLCGKYADNRIDDPTPGQGLEDVGIDHVSLWYLAEAGGGGMYVHRNPRGLAEVFTKASAVRHRWFEVHYTVPSSNYHRRQFLVRIDFKKNKPVYTDIKLFPNPWLDGPGGLETDIPGWTEPRSFWSSLGVLFTTLGLLASVSVLGAASFNIRRALFRRAGRKRD